jgi:hypothetical protein
MSNKRKPLSEATKQKISQKALERNNKQSKGLGDTIEKFTEATGIKSVVKAVSKALDLECGCAERKDRLNKLFPYKSLKCLNNEDYLYLKDFFMGNPEMLNIKQQRELIRIYKAVFDVELKHSNCPDCWRSTVANLRKVYSEHKDLDNAE